MDEYDKLFEKYFDKFEIEVGNSNPQFRGVPIRGGGLGGLNAQNCIGDPNDLKCPKGYFCNASIRQWQCL